MKKIISLILAGVIVFSLTACGSPDTVEAQRTTSAESGTGEVSEIYTVADVRGKVYTRDIFARD